ncbi:MAG: rod shape-determining protein RodA [Parachlamydiaceae bacterium]|nr:rod shape-determining protein RodA [Parachlamydiaceae bacterium]
MWNYQSLSRIDLRVVFLILILMVVSVVVIAAQSAPDPSFEGVLTPIARSQIQWFLMGWVVFIFCAAFDYNKLREWTWVLYILMIVALLGLFLTDPIQRVQRWYRLPLINIGFQPSEAAKLISVIALSWFLERRKMQSRRWSTVFSGLLIIGIPFILILKQPDLGTALILFPVTLVMFYFGDLRPRVIQVMGGLAFLALLGVAVIFLGIVPHEAVRPYATKVIKNYQFDRLDPNTHHQKASITAIALGGMMGSGWRNSTFTGGGWLPTPYTDAIFPAFGEEFGWIGMVLLMCVFYLLISCCFQVSVVAKDHFGCLLSAGIAVYLAVHILINIGMMSGFFPITGVPLPLVSYGGTSILATMAALGIQQSIYSRRFMF